MSSERQRIHTDFMLDELKDKAREWGDLVKENMELREENKQLKEKLKNIKNWVKESRYGSDGAIDARREEVDILLEILGIYKEYYNRSYTGPKTLNELYGSDEE